MSNPKFGGMTSGGLAARSVAINSMQNIGRLGVGDDTELAKISELLRQAEEPLPVAKVADQLEWNADKASQALALGGTLGIFAFSRDDDTMVVRMAEK